MCVLHVTKSQSDFRNGKNLCCFQSQGDTALDTLHQWQRMYSRELDQETRQKCVTTEKLLRKALAGGGEAFAGSFASETCNPLIFSLTAPAAPAPAKPFDTLQDSQLFDAENSEPPSTSGGGGSSSQDWPQHNPDGGVYTPASPERWQSRGSSQRHRPRGTESAVLYGVEILKISELVLF